MSTVVNNLRAAVADVEQMARENDELRLEVARLAKENDGLCDTVWELRQQLRDLTTTEGAGA